MKYKVGDIVKIREDLVVGKKYGGIILTEVFARYRGRISMIDFCYTNSNTYEIKDSLLTFPEEMIEGFAENKTKENVEMHYSNIKGETEKFHKLEECVSLFVKIKDYVIIVPNKVVEVLFEDSKTEKMVCQEKDDFDIRRCLFIALAKHMYKQEYTFEGIEYKANEMMYIKRYVKMVDDVIKKHIKGELVVQKKKQQEQEEKERIARRRAKRYAYKERRKQKEEARQIEMQKEAYLKAMKEHDLEKAEKKKSK